MTSVGKKRLKVKIAGEEFSIFTDEDSSHVNEITNFVNKKIDEVSEKASGLSKTLVLAMTCMNLADELVRMGDWKYEDVKSRVNDKMADMLDKKITALEAELSENRELLKLSEARVVTLQKLLTEKEEQLQEDKDKINDFIVKMNELSYK